MKKTAMIVISVLILSFFLPLTSFAENLDSKIQEKNEKIEAITKDQESAQKYLAELENQIADLEAEYHEVLEEKSTQERKLNQLNHDIQSLEIKIDKRKKQLDNQAREAQVNQSASSFMNVLANADSLTDVLNKTIAIATLMTANNDVMKNQVNDKEDLDKLKNKVVATLDEIEQHAAILQEKEVNLAETKLEQDVKINEIGALLATEQAEKTKYINQKEAAEKKKQAELKAIQEENEKRKQAEAQFKEQEQENNIQVPPSVPTPPSAEQTPPSSSGWGMPVANPFITSPFGHRDDPTGISGTFHDGIDFGGSSSTTIFASRTGTVVQSGYLGMAGNAIVIDHGDGYYSYYLHMSNLLASTGSTVAAGQAIGIMGTTGNSTGVHLHFSIATSPNWSGYLDPAAFLGL